MYLGQLLGRVSNVGQALLQAVTMCAERQHTDAEGEPSAERGAREVDVLPGVDVVEQLAVQSVQLAFGAPRRSQPEGRERESGLG